MYGEFMKINWKKLGVEILRVIVAALAGSLAGCKFALFNV